MAGRRYFDAHFHWFQGTDFGNQMAENIGDKGSAEHFLLKYHMGGCMAGGIVMGNGRLDCQGIGLPDHFYYCLGLDDISVFADISSLLRKVESHLQRKKCLGIKLYPGYLPHYPSSEIYRDIFLLLMKYNKVLAVHTGMMAGRAGKLKYAHPLQLDDVAADYPELRIVMCHFGNPFLSEAAAVMEHNENVYADLSGLIEGPFCVEEFYSRQGEYLRHLKMWIDYVGRPEAFLFGSDWPAVVCDEYAEFVASLFSERDRDKVLFKNAIEVYGIEDMSYEF